MIIALITDFGTRDFFVGALKGVILTINPEAKIIDITHEIEPQNIRSAGFTLAQCYQDFPFKTIFVAVVDPEVGSARRAILVETENYYFLAPDNGLLSFILANEKKYRIYELNKPKYFRRLISQTFHGRDVFAPVAAWLSTGVKSKSFGSEIKEQIRLKMPQPKRISNSEIEAEIIHIDIFGNLITNLKSKHLPKTYAVLCNKVLVEKHQTYYSLAEKDDVFTIFGSCGFLEIVCYKNSAEKILGVTIGDKIIVKT